MGMFRTEKYTHSGWQQELKMGIWLNVPMKVPTVSIFLAKI
jgi:hypothetical protein